jgi:Holliday junction resolvasome RuvABC endonuclease subunit
MAHARGVIILAATRRKVRVEEYPANRIKQSVAGHGHAGKHQMQLAIQSVWNLKDPPEPPDVADALAVALCCGREMELVALRRKNTRTSACKAATRGRAGAPLPEGESQNKPVVPD